VLKSIFTRLLITYLVITVVVVLALTATVSVIYKEAIFQAKKGSLEAAALKTVSLAEDYLKDDISGDELAIAVNAMGYSTDAMIYVLKIDPNKFAESKALSINGISDAFVSSNMGKILDGQPVYLEKQYSEDFGLYVLFAGYPLKMDAEVKGAVLLFCPIGNISSDIASVNRTFGFAALVVMLLSVPLIYLNARRISRPIREMSLAARKIAALENLDPATSLMKDEIGMLGRSFDEMKDRLEKTEKIRRELIANVSHELRTPLTSISGFVQAMLDGVVSTEDQSEYLLIIKEETARLSRLTNELLELAKIQAGNLRLEIETVHLNDLVDQVLSTEKIAAMAKKIKLGNVISVPIFVNADIERLKQILINVVSNALKFTPDHGVVTIDAEQQGLMATIVVSDNGIGITAEDLPFIFDKFYCSDKFRTSEVQSTGLGLSIAKNLVELLGGSISAESTPGSGTIIRFTIPLAMADEL